MKYLLINITQKSPLRTGILLVLGGLMWLPSLLSDNGVLTEATSKGAIWVSMVLTLLNSILITHLFYKGKETSLPLSFVGTSYWFAMSAVPAIHSCWQAQMVIAGVLLAGLVLMKMDFQHEATEESFLATLIVCLTAIHPSVLLTSIMTLWVYMITKQQMTWRVWFASLIAIAVRVILMIVLHYCGWLEMVWLENIPQLSGMQWLWFASIFSVTALIILLPLRKPSIASGITYLTLTILLAAIGVLWHGEIIPL